MPDDPTRHRERLFRALAGPGQTATYRQALADQGDWMDFIDDCLAGRDIEWYVNRKRVKPETQNKGRNNNAAHTKLQKECYRAIRARFGKVPTITPNQSGRAQYRDKRGKTQTVFYGRAGRPDFDVTMPRQGGGVWYWEFEVKTGDAEQSEKQKEWEAEAVNRGRVYRVIRRAEECVDVMLRTMGMLL